MYLKILRRLLVLVQRVSCTCCPLRQLHVFVEALGSLHQTSRHVTSLDNIINNNEHHTIKPASLAQW